MELPDEIKKLYSQEDVPVELEVPKIPIILVSAVVTIIIGSMFAGRFKVKNFIIIPTPTPTLFVQPSTTNTPQVSPTIIATAKPTSKPIRIPTFAPLPTLPPLTIPTSVPLPTSRPVLNCAGTATEEKSQVYISPRTLSTGSSSTVSIELRDCNNALAADDWMSADLVSNSPTAKINGLPFPQRIQAAAGRVTFTVTSQTAGTVSFKLTNTNQNFLVTEPGYKTPYIIFTSEAAPTQTQTQTPNPTQTLTPTPI